jgi:membrane protein YqaA with SNARE-associated domain
MAHWLARIDVSSFLTPAQLVATTFGVGFLSGFIPLVNIEGFLISAVVLGGASSSLGLVIASTLGQMAAKCVLYLSGRGVVTLPLHRYADRMDRIREWLARRAGHAGVVLFVSALVGFPPFYALSILAGTTRIPFAVFVVAGTIGRFLRFALFVWAPQLMIKGAR